MARHLLAFLCAITGALAAPLTDPHAACPKYQYYSQTPQSGISHSNDKANEHSSPLTKGELQLPYQRPSAICRTFTSPAVEQVIKDMTSRMRDVDLARLFENAFPNTLDTTISWHVDKNGKGSKPAKSQRNQYAFVDNSERWKGAHSFIVTGDITAEWIRDSTNQLQGYQALASRDPELHTLILGAINTQAEYMIASPYCNAFQPPPPSGLGAATGGPVDDVSPSYDTNVVMECKYELDSLGHFLKLANEFHQHTKNTDWLTPRFLLALRSVLDVVKHQSKGSFDKKSGRYIQNEYRFQRITNIGTETLSLGGIGNPIKGETGLIRSAFRPSDDATILPFFIPANAMMVVELRRMADILKADHEELSEELSGIAEKVDRGIKKYGIVKHEDFGEVYAYEVDGFGSHIFMDDANIPSLLALPHLGYLEASDPIYQNTRKMILSKAGNPYYLEGVAFAGIGGPHVGLRNAWPMSRLIQAMTSDDDGEIMNSIMAVRDSSKLGLVHESVNIQASSSYTRSWFAWANSVFAQTILDVAKRKPHLIFGMGSEPYDVEAPATWEQAGI